MQPILDRDIWASVPFHFWSVVLFTFGCMVGSFLNVCIHRMPLGMSVVSPPSHCPHCGYSIPWFLNVPLITWLSLRGRCANCSAPIAVRYFLVELLTGALFLAAWLQTGRDSTLVALVYCVILAGFVVATFIDFEHFIIPDEITIGGMVVGVVASIAVPQLHGTESRALAMLWSGVGLAVGWGVVYLVLRAGKLMFGKQDIQLPPDTRVIFTETGVVLPDREIPFEEIFYRKSDAIQIQARSVEMPGRNYKDVELRLMPEKLIVAGDEFDPESIPRMEVVTDRIVVPREAMGFGDVKFMGAIGAFLGWKAALFSLLASSVIGATVGLLLIALRRQQLSGRLPYGPYIALAATLWMFGGYRLADWWLSRMLPPPGG